MVSKFTQTKKSHEICSSNSKSKSLYTILAYIVIPMFYFRLIPGEGWREYQLVHGKLLRYTMLRLSNVIS